MVASAAVAAIVGYLGITGGLGGPIPGTEPGNGATTPPPPRTTPCEGGGTGGSHWFDFVGGASSTNQWININGSLPGPCVLVAVDSTITVVFSVGAHSPLNHSWVLVNASANSSALPAFPGAGFSNSTRFTGVAPGGSVTFHFDATRAGSYRYICEVPGHDDAGMWGWFNVTASSSHASAVAAPWTTAGTGASAGSAGGGIVLGPGPDTFVGLAEYAL